MVHTLDAVTSHMARVTAVENKSLKVTSKGNCKNSLMWRFQLSRHWLAKLVVNNKKLAHNIQDKNYNSWQFHYYWINDKPTRENIQLDLISTTNQSLVKTSTKITGISDHVIVKTDMETKTKKKVFYLTAPVTKNMGLHDITLNWWFSQCSNVTIRMHNLSFFCIFNIICKIHTWHLFYYNIKNITTNFKVLHLWVNHYFFI